MNFLLQPKKYKSLAADAGSRAIMDKTIAFFENMGKTRLTEDFNRKVWYRGFVDFIAGEQIFAKLLTPRAYAGGDPDCRWDTARNSEYSELLAFYGLGYWYCFQVSILGLGPIWMSANEDGETPGRRVPQARGDLRLRPLRAGARRRHLRNRDHPHTPGGRHLGGERREVLHRQRQRGRDGLHPGQDQGRHRRLRLLRDQLPAQGLRAEEERHFPPGVRGQLCPARLSHRRGRPALPGPGRMGCGAQHREHRQVQHRPGLHRRGRALLLRGHHPCGQPHPLWDTRHRHAPRAEELHGCLAAPGGHEALPAPRHRLLPQRIGDAIGATCSTTPRAR